MLAACRWLMGWLLLLALPIQGYAAGVRLHCAPADAPATMAMHASQHHDMSLPASHPTAGMDAAMSHDVHAAHHGSTPATADGSQHDTAGCSACALCCGGLALPSTLTVPLAQRATFHYPPPDALPLIGGRSAVLERPPRLLAA